MIGHMVGGSWRQFLLLPRPAQVWHYLLGYLRQNCAGTAAELGGAVSLVLKCGMAELGRDYPLDALTEAQQLHLPHLTEVGPTPPLPPASR